MTEKELTRCPNCHTRTLVSEGEGESRVCICSECKGRFPAPETESPKPGTSIFEKNEYYEGHKDEIIQDLLATGRTATRQKWQIPSSTMAGLEKRWLTRQQRRALTRASARARKSGLPVATGSDGGLPQLPEFSNSWEPQVQVMWLECYKQLLCK